jgi:hypothetical protein
MAEQQLDGAQIGAGFQQMDGKGMAQGVRRDGPADAAFAPCRSAGDLDGAWCDRLAGKVAGKPPLLRPGGAPVVSQDVQQPGREHHVAVLPPFALRHADDHAVAVDGSRRQADGFGNPQAGRVAHGQDDAVLQRRDAVEEAENLVAVQYDGKPLRLAAGGDHLIDAPVPLERDLVEKAEGGDRDQDRTGRELPLVGQMQPIDSDIFRPQHRGRLAEVAGKLRDLLEIRALRLRREVADLHVLDHATTKRGH